MKYNSVVFDLDGTLLDTLEDLKNSVNFALVSNGLQKRSTEEVRAFVGNGIRLLIERAVPENTPAETVDKCFKDFKEHYKNNSANFTKAYEGIVELLKELKSNGVKISVVSNKADFAVKILAEKYFSGLLDCAYGEREGIKRKPSPDSVYAVIKETQSDMKSTVYVGDSEVDIETAKNSGIPCIAVTWGFRDKMLLQSLNPDYVADTPKQILEIINEVCI